MVSTTNFPRRWQSLAVFAFFLFSGAWQPVLAETCTEANAFDRMLALNRAQGQMMMKNPNSASNPAIKMNEDMWEVSKLIAAKKYDEACKLSDQLAIKYKVDIKNESARLLTYEQLKKDGGKGAGECSLADVSKRMMGLHQQLEDRAAAGEVSRDVFRTFSEDTKPIGDLMVTNPDAACKKLDEIKAKYQLH